MFGGLACVFVFIFELVVTCNGSIQFFVGKILSRFYLRKFRETYSSGACVWGCRFSLLIGFWFACSSGNLVTPYEVSCKIRSRIWSR